MPRNQRIVLLGLAAIVVVVGVVISVSGDSKKKKPAKPAGPAEQLIRVVNAKPVGGVQKITVHKGAAVRLAVQSDTADEIHIHGYDFHKTVTNGGTVHFAFPAKIDGVFVIELEKRAQQIASLRVTP
ncbi:MAG TPA: hypothetical protein VHE14_07885 [Solirubrobacteraceae bacterium]|nr:hypothetical protein [Solirubrobacteraceae bacterium]